jgi:hypothetical protein
MPTEIDRFVHAFYHREFLQFLQIPIQRSGEEQSSHAPSGELEFDAEWLAVLRRTHHLLQTHRGAVHLPTQINAVTQEACRHCSTAR